MNCDWRLWWGESTDVCHVPVNCGICGLLLQTLTYRSKSVFIVVFVFRSNFTNISVLTSAKLSTTATTSFFSFSPCEHLTIELTLLCLAQVCHVRACAKNTTLNTMIIRLEANMVLTCAGAEITAYVSLFQHGVFYFQNMSYPYLSSDSRLSCYD